MTSKAKVLQKQSGRRVTHSRGGCLTCKSRKLRCPEDKPVCSRCYRDNRACSYGVQLQWEDDARKRGIKHGRTIRADRASLSATESSIWITLPKGQSGRHFLNTFTSDVEDAVVPVLEGLNFDHETSRWQIDDSLYTSPTIAPTLFVSKESDPRVDPVLFDYYNRSVSNAIPLVDSSSNFFRHMILPLALSDESVMHMVLAIGALALAAKGQQQLYRTALRHKQHSMQLLRKRISEDAYASATDANIIVILMLCVFETSDNCQISWTAHLSAAIDLIRLAASHYSAAGGISPQVAEFVSRFFLVKDALGRTACQKVAKFKDELIPIDTGEIDVSIGCSYGLIDILSRITDLARDLRFSITTRAASRPQILEIENQLSSLTQRLPQHIISSSSLPPPTSSLTTDLDQATILYHSSNLMHTAATLYLQATLHAINPYSSTARSLIAQIRAHTQPLSPIHLRSAHLWPLFVGAVFSTGDDSERLWFLDQFDVLEKGERALVARGAVGRVRMIVERVWKRRDLDGAVARETGENAWLDWERYVQPLSDGLCLG